MTALLTRLPELRQAFPIVELARLTVGNDLLHVMVLYRSSLSDTPEYYVVVNDHRHIRPFPAVTSDSEAQNWLRDLACLFLRSTNHVRFSLTNRYID